MNLHDAKTVLNYYLSTNIPAFLWGAPGIGKSDIVREIANDENEALIDLRAILLDPIDLRGLPSVSGDSAKWLPPEFLPNVEKHGEKGILFLDELNAAPPSVQAACFQLVLDRRVGEYILPEGWRIVAAGNRQSDRSAAQRMPTALANRFAHIDIDACHKAFIAWANNVDLDPMVTAFINFRPELLHKMEGSELRAFPTPRAWANVAKVANAPDNIRMNLVTGIIGEGVSAEFEGFVRTYKDLPDLDNLIQNPEIAPLPPSDKPANHYAIATALSRKATQENFANILTYMQRLPREFDIMATIDAVNRDKSLCETRAFVDWASRNQDITL